MTRILALDTSSENCSVALCLGSGEIDCNTERTPRSHTQLVLPMVRDLLAKHEMSLAQVDAIAFGKGPGSFTGIRIASGIAQGLAFGADKPIYGISCLEAMALQRHLSNGARYVLVATDARMNEVYWGVFKVEEETCGDKSAVRYHVSALTNEGVSAPEDINLEGLPLSELSGIGSGFEFVERFPQSVQDKILDYDVNAQPSADVMCLLAENAIRAGECGDISDALPSYVRDTVTWKKLPGRE